MEETSKFVKEEAIQDDDVKLDGVDPVFSNEQDDCSDNADKTEENFKFVKEDIQLQDDEDEVAEENCKFVKEEIQLQDDDDEVTEKNLKFVKEEIQLQDDEDDVKNNANPVFLQAEAEELAR